jgi:hypothetical protein
MDAQRRLHVLHSHLTPVDEYPGESQLQAVDCSSSSVGQEWAQPHGYSVALPERLASNDFNVYRCVRACVCACVAPCLEEAPRVRVSFLSLWRTSLSLPLPLGTGT